VEWLPARAASAEPRPDVRAGQASVWQEGRVAGSCTGRKERQVAGAEARRQEQRVGRARGPPSAPRLWHGARTTAVAVVIRKPVPVQRQAGRRNPGGHVHGRRSVATAGHRGRGQELLGLPRLQRVLVVQSKEERRVRTRPTQGLKVHRSRCSCSLLAALPTEGGPPAGGTGQQLQVGTLQAQPSAPSLNCPVKGALPQNWCDGRLPLHPGATDCFTRRGRGTTNIADGTEEKLTVAAA